MKRETLWSLDRIEGEYAVLIDDTGVCVTIPWSDLPVGAAEGKMYRKVGESYVEDPIEEQMRRECVRMLQNRLRNRKNK